MQAAHFEALMAAAGAPTSSAWSFDVPLDRAGCDPDSDAGYAADTWEFTFERAMQDKWSPALQASVLLAVQRLPQVRPPQLPSRH